MLTSKKNIDYVMLGMAGPIAKKHRNKGDRACAVIHKITECIAFIPRFMSYD